MPKNYMLHDYSVFFLEQSRVSHFNPLTVAHHDCGALYTVAYKYFKNLLYLGGGESVVTSFGS